MSHSETTQILDMTAESRTARRREANRLTLRYVEAAAIMRLLRDGWTVSFLPDGWIATRGEA